MFYTDLPGNCSQAKVVIYSGIGDSKGKLATICSQEDAEKSIVHIDDFLATVEYHVKIAGLRGFRASVVDKCNTGFKPARNGTTCEGTTHVYACTNVLQEHIKPAREHATAYYVM